MNVQHHEWSTFNKTKPSTQFEKLTSLKNNRVIQLYSSHLLLQSRNCTLKETITNPNMSETSPTLKNKFQTEDSIAH